MEAEMAAPALVERRRNSPPPHQKQTGTGRNPAGVSRSVPVAPRPAVRFEGPEKIEPAPMPAAWTTAGSVKKLTDQVRSPAQDAAIEAELARGKTPRLAAAHAILFRHWKGRNSPEEVMLELYYAPISVAAADKVARLLWGDRAGAALVADCQQEAVLQIKTWLERKIAEPQVYVFLQSIGVRQKVDGGTRVTNLLAAVGVNPAGIREGLGVAEGDPTGDIWDRLLADLKRRGLAGTRLFIGDNEPAAQAAIARHFPDAGYQGCLERMERGALAKVPVSQVHSLMGVFEGLRAATDEVAARAQLAALGVRLRKDRLVEASALIEQCASFQFSYLRFPAKHWGRLRDTEPLKGVLRDFREHIRLIGPLVNIEVLVLMVATRMRYAAKHFWSQRRYINF